MSGTTSNYALPFLELDDPPDIAGISEGISTAVDTELDRIDGDVANLKTRSTSKRASPRTTTFGLLADGSWSPDLQSVSVSGDGTTVYEIVCLIPAVFSTVAGDRVEFGLYVAGSQVGGALFTAAAGAGDGGTIVATFTPTVSAQTVSLRGRKVSGGAGVVTYYTSASNPGQLYARPL